MKLETLGKIFHVKYGNSLELNKLKQLSGGINFVSRTGKNNGVSAKVQLLSSIPPTPANTITVALGGSVLSTFLQPEPFYSGYHIYCLTPILSMTDEEKLFYCSCIEANKYRFNYGRQANRTLKDLLLPSRKETPSWVDNFNLNAFDSANQPYSDHDHIELNIHKWAWFEYQELFDIERGKGPRKKDLDGTGTIPVVTSTDSNNGWSAVTNVKPMHDENTIGVNRNGSIAEAFYQPIPFCSTEDVHIFKPKFPLNQYVALFLSTIIKREKYRYNYGRKWGIARMKKSKMKLPVNDAGNPDYTFMENYIKSLPFSKNI